MKIIIVGAGLGGLAAAYRFAQLGHEVQVLERQPGLSPRGSGITLRPGASRILIKWGLESDMEAVSDLSPAAILRNLHTGEISMRNVAVDISEYPDWCLPRQVLQGVLYKNAQKVGAKITFNTAVEGVKDGEDGVYVTLPGGKKLHADLIFAADGIRSHIRSAVLADVDEEKDPIVSKTTLYSVNVPADQIKGDPAARTLSEQVNLTIHMGRDGFVVSRMSIKSNSWGALFAINAETDQKSLWDEEGDIEYVREFFTSRGVCPELGAALRLAPKCDRWKLAQLPDISRWASKNGHILLLGDSVHAMEPNAAQGFSQIVEDIEVLEYLLAKRGTSNMVELTTLWQNIRRPRVERIKQYAHWNTRMFSGEPLAAQDGNEQRNVKSLKNVKPNRDASFHSSAFVKWSLDYDAIEEARKYLGSNDAKARL